MLEEEVRMTLKKGERSVMMMNGGMILMIVTSGS